MAPIKNQHLADLKNPWMYWIALGIFIVPVSLVKIYDPDVWWHMQVGKDLFNTGKLPDFLNYYFTPVVRTVPDLRFTWLGDIFLYLIHLATGDVGLQVLRLVAVFLACFLLKSLCTKRMDSWQLFCLMIFVLGTYQKQLIRNSLFSLIFTPLVFWLWWQVRHRDKEHLIWFFPVLIGVWGCIHGSYLVGFGLMTLLFIGDSIDSFRKINKGKKPLYLKYTSVTAVTFMIISLWNPLTSHFYGIEGFKRLFSKQISPSISQDIAEKPSNAVNNKEEGRHEKQYVYAQVDTSGIKKGFETLKKALNDTIFEYSDHILRSGDFMSPFDLWHRLYVKIGMAVGLAGVIFILFFIRPVRLSTILPLAAVLVFGLGYLRMVGYISMVVFAVLFISISTGEFKLKIPEKPFLAICGVLIVLVYVNMASGYRVPIGTEMHAFGFGRIPSFSEKIPDKAFNDYKEKPTLTTILNGGYLLYRWYPEKKVFTDGFFAPHRYSLLSDYTDLISGKMDTDSLFEKYATEVAIIEQTRTSLILMFLRSKNWHLKYIDKGNMMFIYQPEIGDSIDVPEILEENSVLYDLPRIYRDRFAFFLYLIQNEMLKKGRLKDVHDFNDKYQSLIAHMNSYMPLKEKERLQLLLTTLTDVYGKTNSEIVQYEMLHYSLLNKADPSEALAYGQKVLEALPNRYPIILNVASLFSQKQQWLQSQVYLDRLWEAKEKDPKFWQSNHYNIAKLYLNLFFMRKKVKDYVEAYSMLRKAQQADAKIIETGKLYDEGIEFVRDLTQSGKSYQAYELLNEMEKDYANSGRLMNEIAWHILTHPQSVFESAENAKQYALKAVKLMEQDQDPLLDASYDTLAEAYYQLEQYDKMKYYETLASKTAPAERKKLHKTRTPKPLRNN